LGPRRWSRTQRIFFPWPEHGPGTTVTPAVPLPLHDQSNVVLLPLINAFDLCISFQSTRAVFSAVCRFPGSHKFAPAVRRQFRISPPLCALRASRRGAADKPTSSDVHPASLSARPPSPEIDYFDLRYFVFFRPFHGNQKYWPLPRVPM